MEEQGLQQDEEYGSMLSVLGRLDREQGWYKEALVIYAKAKAVLAQHKEGNAYGLLLTDMHLPQAAAAMERGRCMLQGRC
jgi:hypothetical protein